MHELPITQSILDQVIRFAKQHHATKVTKIHLKLGEYSGFVDDSIEFYWDIIAKDTIAKGAKFHFTRTKGHIKCLKCNKILSSLPANRHCPRCKSFKLVSEGGDQLEIDNIEIEEGNDQKN